MQDLIANLRERQQITDPFPCTLQPTDPLIHTNCGEQLAWDISTCHNNPINILKKEICRQYYCFGPQFFGLFVPQLCGTKKPKNYRTTAKKLIKEVKKNNVS